MPTIPTASRAALVYRLATDAYPTFAPVVDLEETGPDRFVAESIRLQFLSLDWRDILHAATLQQDSTAHADALETLRLINAAAAEVADELRALGEHTAADTATSWCPVIPDDCDF
jgi:hypothetical protein